MKFFKYGVSVFDGRQKQFGGFNHWIAKYVFRWRLCYLDIYLEKQFKFEICHKKEESYYDGYHNSIWIGFVLISYGT